MRCLLRQHLRHVAAFIRDFDLRFHKLPARLPIREQDVRQKFILERRDPAFDGFEFGLDDQG